MSDGIYWQPTDKKIRKIFKEVRKENKKIAKNVNLVGVDKGVIQTKINGEEWRFNPTGPTLSESGLKTRIEDIVMRKVEEVAYPNRRNKWSETKRTSTDFECPECRTHTRPTRKIKYSGYSTKNYIYECNECGHQFKKLELHRARDAVRRINEETLEYIREDKL